MLIAVDWDGTVTRDPEWFLDVIRSAQRRGHEVIIVTGRSPAEEITAAPRDLKVCYTDGRAKKAWLEFRDVHVDVWFDDDPLRVVKDFESLEWN